MFRAGFEGGVGGFGDDFGFGLLGPPMVAVWIGADVVELHLCFGFLGVRLKSQK